MSSPILADRGTDSLSPGLGCMGTSSQLRRTILVVEDHVLIRLHAVSTLKMEGLQVLQAANAAEALTILKTDPSVAVLFTDIEMPGGMNGLNLAQKVHAQWPYVELVLTSGRDQPPEEDIPDNGTFLAKPYAPEKLTAVIGDKLARASGAQQPNL